MKTEKQIIISFSGLKNGKHQFEFRVGSEFFENYGFTDFNNIDATIEVLLNKQTTILEMHFNAKAVVNVPCDVTNQDFDLHVEDQMNLIVKFGDKYDDDHDEILIIPYTEHQVDISQYIYELIALAIPTKRVHPGVLDGTLESEALSILGYENGYEQDNLEEDLEMDFLDSLFPDDQEEEEENEEIDDQSDHENKEIDPRWAVLKKLLTDK